ncbi:MAG: serine hydrolase domain-containing protein, partial [Acidobacteriota bacterium]|nr:serine hydrolase domain-containing protein [Acidobacteriota bacterium]
MPVALINRRSVFLGIAAVVSAAMFLVPVLRAAEDVTVVEPESVGMSSERLQRINTFISDYIDANEIAGAVTLVARKGKVVHYDAQGWRDKENGVRMTHDTIFEMMSMTKPIVSTALMMLFEEGRFLLDDPISKWLPEYENHSVRINGDGVRPVIVQEARPVTVRHVLTHTSGLTLNPRNKGLSEAQIADVTNDGKGWATLAERVAHAAVV